MIELLIWLGISIYFGFVEGLLFHYVKNLNQRFKAKTKLDIHVLFGLIRFIVWLPLLLRSEHGFLFAISSLFCFPFLHDGFYYLTRNICSGGKLYKKTFFDQSTTTTAKISIGSFWRLMLFLFGIGFIFAL